MLCRSGGSAAVDPAHRQGGIFQGDDVDLPGAGGGIEGDLPGAGGAEFTADLDQELVNAVATQELEDLVDGISLQQGSEVDADGRVELAECGDGFIELEL